MRILYGITKSNWGGAQRYVYDLALATQEAGHDVSVLCGGEGVLVEKLKKVKIRVIPLSALGRDITLLADIKSFFQILSVLKKEKPDVFHINSSKMGGVGALAGRLTGIKKIIFTAHGWAFNEPRPWYQKLIITKLVWLTVLLTHKTICVSEKTKRDIAWLPFISKKLIVIRNGLDQFVIKPKKEGGNLVVGTIAELHKVKGLDIALRAFARAFKYTDTALEIVGEGEERKNLEGLTKDLGLESQVKFLGFKDNAREMLGQFDIFILSSRSEAMPYAPLEAGLAFLPVIATDVGGIPEIIKDGETGLLIPKENPEALAKALKKLSVEPQLRKTLGENLHRFVKENFSRRRMLKETFNLYTY